MDGFSESHQEGVIRSDMDSGPPKARVRFTATVRRIAATYYLDAAQKAQLDTLYLTYPAATFTWPDPLASYASTTVRFALRPTFRIAAGATFFGTVNLEELP